MNFDQMIIHFSSPTICGIKPANLFSVKEQDFCHKVFEGWKVSLQKIGISAVAINRSNGTVIILVYNIRFINSILNNEEISSYLEKKGYSLVGDSLCPDSAINLLSQKLQIEIEFPHEIGVFLGYPISDVVAFEKNQGKNCKYCGLWKCYTNVENARECECKFRQCSCMCCKWFEEGCSLHQIIKNYKNAALAA